MTGAFFFGKTMQNTFDISINGEAREIFMSFGLLNELTRIVQDPARIGLMAIDPDMREDVLYALLAERKPSGKILKPLPDIDDIEADYLEIERLLAWAMEHTLGFFVRLLQSAATAAEREKTQMVDLVSSLTGSPDSVSKTA